MRARLSPTPGTPNPRCMTMSAACAGTIARGQGIGCIAIRVINAMVAARLPAVRLGDGRICRQLRSGGTSGGWCLRAAWIRGAEAPARDRATVHRTSRMSGLHRADARWRRPKGLSGRRVAARRNRGTRGSATRPRGCPAPEVRSARRFDSGGRSGCSPRTLP